MDSSDPHSLLDCVISFPNNSGHCRMWLVVSIWMLGQTFCHMLVERMSLFLRSKCLKTVRCSMKHIWKWCILFFWSSNISILLVLRNRPHGISVSKFPSKDSFKTFGNDLKHWFLTDSILLKGSSSHLMVLTGVVVPKQMSLRLFIAAKNTERLRYSTTFITPKDFSRKETFKKINGTLEFLFVWSSSWSFQKSVSLEQNRLCFRQEQFCGQKLLCNSHKLSSTWFGQSKIPSQMLCCGTWTYDPVHWKKVGFLCNPQSCSS